MKSKIYDNLEMICDYLTTESRDENHDYKRRKRLYEIFEIEDKKCKYLPGKLGETIVSLYYEILKVPYQITPKPISYIEDEKKATLRPDGLENDLYYVEVKCRTYRSSGTAHEKIPSIPWKYRVVPKKLKIFLLADDEHKYNIFWRKLMTSEIEPTSIQEKRQITANKTILEDIITGTQISDLIKSQTIYKK